MTVDLLAISLSCGFFALVVAAVLLVRRSERRLGRGPGAPSAPSMPGPDGGTDPIAAYLDRMSGELALPAADVAEVRAELANHLLDSIESLEAEGLDRETAIREALGRLGPAVELGRQIRAAHQSTRRLLAGAGGGVFAAGGGFVLGYIGGGFAVAAVAVGIAALMAGLAAAGLHLPDLLQDPHGIGGNSILIGLTTTIAAWAATRYAVRTSASVSHRTPHSVAVVWAAAGGLGFGWWALFGLHGYQSGSTVAAELCIPVAAVAGAFVRIERPLPHSPRWAVVVGLIAFIVVPLVLFAAVGSSGSGSGSGQAASFQASDLHLDTVAPMAPAQWLPDQIMTSGADADGASGATVINAQRIFGQSTLPIAPLLSNWRDLRFESWHALPEDEPGPGGIDTHYTSPFAVQPAALNGESLDATFDFGRLRDAGSWWVLLTAVGPDGHRYRLDEFGYGGSSDFSGSAWDWLMAPQ